jgi:RND family efflux transporter MFP subunit
MKRTLVTVAVAILFAALAWRIWEKVAEKRAAGAPREPGGRPAAAVPVVVEPVRIATIRDVRMFTGTLRPDSEFELMAKISGRLDKLTVRLGEPVERGQLIAQLDDDEHVRRVEQAQAELDVAKANAESVRLDAELEDQELAQKVVQVEAELGIAKANVAERASNLNVAEREFERAKTLRDKTIMSQSSLDEAEARYLAEKARKEVALAQVAEKEAALTAAKVRLSQTQKDARANDVRLAQAQVAQREAALRSAEVQLGYTRIRAEWEGGAATRYVGQRFVDEGTMLTSNTPILTVVDLAKLRAFIYVIERDYPKMKVDQTAAISTDAYPGRIFEGHIARISKVLQETSRQALVEVEIDNRDLRLKPGMFVRLEIEFAEHENATVIPRAAFVRHSDKRGVFLLDDEEKTVTFVPVTAGITTATQVEVLEPALEGSVVTLGQHLLSDGAAVIISTFEAAQAPATEE